MTARINKIHHIGKVVSGIKAEMARYKRLGFLVDGKIYIDKEQKVKIGKVGLDGDIFIELVEPLNKNSPIANSSPGLHHICLEVDNIDAYIAYITDNNLGFRLTKKTLSIFKKKEVAFFAMKNRDIIELIEK